MLVLDADEAVLHLVSRARRRRVLVRDGVVGVLERDATGVAVERGGEEERLALGRALGDDAVDRRAEAHVEHAVGLVEDEDADAVEREGAALEEVLQAAGGRDDDVRLGRLARLLGDAGAAVDGADLERPGVGDRVDLVDDLGRELARRREDQRRGARAVGLDAVDDRHAEGERLARARGALGEDVTPGEDVGDDEVLDGERRGDPALLQSRADRGGHAEIGEGLTGQDEDSCNGTTVGRERFGRRRQTRTAHWRDPSKLPRSRRRPLHFAP